MSKITTITTLLLCFTLTVFAQNKLPFIGTRYFNIPEGSCCNESITIYKNGQCIIKAYEAPELGTNVTVTYKGKFMPIIWFYKNGKKDYGYQFGYKYVSQINKFGKIAKGKHGDPKELFMAELYDSF
jgi:hypothetical protein